MKLIVKCVICNIQGLILEKPEISEDLIQEMKDSWGCDCGASPEGNVTILTEE